MSASPAPQAAPPLPLVRYDVSTPSHPAPLTAPSSSAPALAASAQAMSGCTTFWKDAGAAEPARKPPTVDASMKALPAMAATSGGASAAVSSDAAATAAQPARCASEKPAPLAAGGAGSSSTFVTLRICTVVTAASTSVADQPTTSRPRTCIATQRTCMHVSC